MSKKKKDMKQEELQEEMENVQPAAEQETPQETTDEESQPEEETPESVIEKLQAQLAKEKKEYLFLMADFDNYRKRTLKEKQEMLKNGAERAMLELLPVVDDFERAIDAMDKSEDIDSMKEGVKLIYNKFVKYLEHNNVKPIESTGKDFDADIHEAITMFPAPSEDMKGKVVDTTLKGYMINDKVLRHAKVVVGQ
ncbi:MAG: nucleotide exchange factor GrpE [Muribaculaceae bacterium]|nr:nucleotide exchange factor GrpE [Muribaculaceae bacterium]